jgi:hypothetical protein
MSDEYKLAVLEDNPTVYLRLDEVGSATSGQTLADESGNSKDFSLCFGNTAGGLEPLGQASAIETDNTSLALRLYTDASFSAGHNYSYSFPGDFTL